MQISLYVREFASLRLLISFELLQRRDDANLLHPLKMLDFVHTHQSHHMTFLTCGRAMRRCGCGKTIGPTELMS